MTHAYQNLLTSYPGLSVLESKFPLCSTDQVIREGSTLNNIISFVVFPGHHQFDIALQVLLSFAYYTVGTPTPLTSGTPKMKYKITLP